MEVRMFCCVAVLLLMTGCSQRNFSQPQKSVTINAPAAELKQVQKKLLAQYQDWKGTSYELGGMSKQGVDCSGLMKLTFAQQFSIDMPRTTAGLAKKGKHIKRKQLRTGDLVFFKTGMKVRHVGIMVDNVQFFHASTSRGVMISRLDNVYWNSHYWQSRRVDL